MRMDSMDGGTRIAIPRWWVRGLLWSFVALAACGGGEDTWPKFHRDLAQSGLGAASASGNSGTLLWKLTTAGRVVSSPAIANDGTIYFGSDDKGLYAVAAGGSAKWKFTAGGAVESSPALASDGTIYFTADTNLYALQPAAGTLKWKFALGGVASFASPALATDGTIYVGSNDGHFYAVTPSGAQSWAFALASKGLVVSSAALAGDGTIYFGTNDVTFYALNPDGTQKWTFQHQSPGASAAAVASDGTIYFGSQDRNLYALEPDGTQKWKFTAGGPIVLSSPAIASDGTIYFGSNDGGLYAVKPDGTLRWKFTAGGFLRGSSPAISADGMVFFGAEDSAVYALKPDGTQKWKFTTAGAVRSSPALAADGTVLVGSNDGNLYALGAGTGPPPGPTVLTLGVQPAGAVCGSISTNLAGEGVPHRLDATTGQNRNSTCTGAAIPLACCTGTASGHCDEANTITCGGLSIGGGGPNVGGADGETAAPPRRVRFSLGCASASDTACPISGNGGDLPNGINCSTLGCGFATPSEFTTPVKYCVLATRSASASGILDLTTGAIALQSMRHQTVYILSETSFTETGCPRCRTGVATTNAPVAASGGVPGAGVCDDDSANPGATCYAWEPLGTAAGLSTDCIPKITSGASAAIPIASVLTTSAATKSDSIGHFCPGQGGRADCTAMGAPSPCCTGPGKGSCNDFDGCFVSANASGSRFADIPATCTALSVMGSPAGALAIGQSPLPIATLAALGCVPAPFSTSPVASMLVANLLGLPGPFAESLRASVEIK